MRWYQLVIQTFGDTTTEDFFHGRRTSRTRRLPRNRLERLRGDLAGFHSIRVNDQWRIIFRWLDAGPADVSLADYH